MNAVFRKEKVRDTGAKGKRKRERERALEMRIEVNACDRPETPKRSARQTKITAQVRFNVMGHWTGGKCGSSLTSEKPFAQRLPNVTVVGVD